MIAVLFLGIVAGLTHVGIRILNQLKREGSRIESQRDANVFLYQLTTEVHNAKRIDVIDPTTLQLTTYDFSKGFDVQTSDVLFDPAQYRTVTYAAVIEDGLPLIRRTETGVGVNRSSKHLQGAVALPTSDPNTALFRMKVGVAACPCDYVSVRLLLQPAFHKGSPIEYAVDATVRSLVN